MDSAPCAVNIDDFYDFSNYLPLSDFIYWLDKTSIVPAASNLTMCDHKTQEALIWSIKDL